MIAGGPRGVGRSECLFALLRRTVVVFLLLACCGTEHWAVSSAAEDIWDRVVLGFGGAPPPVAAFLFLAPVVVAVVSVASSFTS